MSAAPECTPLTLVARLARSGSVQGRHLQGGREGERRCDGDGHSRLQAHLRREEGTRCHAHAVRPATADAAQRRYGDGNALP
eukprot:4565383-Prymnesium_polylepis.1